MSGYRDITMNETEKNPLEQFDEAVQAHGKYHSSDCENAHEPRCRCWCRGKYHGAKTGFLAVIKGETIGRDLGDNDRVMILGDGGEVAEQIRKFKNVQFNCIGICHKPIAASPIIGYPDHEGGFADKDGRKWWLFIHCVYCGYDTSLWKIKNARLEPVEVAP